MNLKAMGQRIQAARKKKKLTQAQFAELAGLSNNYISAIERGVKTPTLENFILFANLLNVNADYLLADFIDASLGVAASELSEQLKNLPIKRQREILQIVRVLIENSD